MKSKFLMIYEIFFSIVLVINLATTTKATALLRGENVAAIVVHQSPSTTTITTTTLRFAPMECRVQEKQTTEAGKVILDFADSRDVCLSICWQLKTQQTHKEGPTKCDFVRYWKYEKRCQIFVTSPTSGSSDSSVSSGGTTTTILEKAKMGEYIWPDQCNAPKFDSNNNNKDAIVELRFIPSKCEGDLHVDSFYEGTNTPRGASARVGLQLLLEDHDNSDHRNILMTTQLAESMQVCASICYQLRTQTGRPCNSINFDGVTCQLLKTQNDGKLMIKPKPGASFMAVEKCAIGGDGSGPAASVRQPRGTVMMNRNIGAYGYFDPPPFGPYM